jgi:large subunit ribosomal protein L17
MTTIAKAKELRRFIEPLVTKARRSFMKKQDYPMYDVHLRREVNRILKDKAAVKTLFEEIAPKVIDRNGGYTRVLKIGRRYGDAAELAFVEFVDYNLEKTESKKTESADSKKPVKDKSDKQDKNRKGGVARRKGKTVVNKKLKTSEEEGK